MNRGRPDRRRRAKRCKFCQAPIRLLEMESGKWLPVDARPSELRGRILIVRGKDRLLEGYEASLHRDEGYDLYVSHWQSCPGTRTAKADARVSRSREAAAARRTARAAFAGADQRRKERNQERLF